MGGTGYGFDEPLKLAIWKDIDCCLRPVGVAVLEVLGVLAWKLVVTVFEPVDIEGVLRRCVGGGGTGAALCTKAIRPGRGTRASLAKGVAVKMELFDKPSASQLLGECRVVISGAGERRGH